MAKALKGSDELRAFRARVIRQFGLERIAEDDYDFLLDKVAEIEQRIADMGEIGDDGEWL